MKPIIFNTEMVRAILDNRKTQTRRVVKLPRGFIEKDKDLGTIYFSTDADGYGDNGILGYEELHKNFNVAPYKVGDILYVRETWQSGYKLDSNEQVIEGTERYFYRASTPNPFTLWINENGERRDSMPWLPSIHMPKEAARIFLKVTNVRAERLQDITPLDAWKEGCRIGNSFPWEDHIPELQQQCRDIVFKTLWDSIYNIPEKMEYRWDTNPWVWVIEFERVKENANIE